MILRTARHHISLTLITLLTGVIFATCSPKGHRTTEDPPPKLPPAVKTSTLKPQRMITGKTFTGNLASVYSCMVKNAYTYMFCTRSSSCDSRNDWGYHGKNSGNKAIDKLGVFTAGTSGFYNSGEMGKCLLRAVGKKERNSWNYKALEVVSGIMSTKGKILKNVSIFNPELISWVATYLIPKPNDPFMGITYKMAYHAMLFRVARLFAHTYIMLHPTMDADANAYRAFVIKHPKKHAVNYLKSTYASKTDHIYYRHEDGTSLTGFHAAGFWLRRHLDGTDKTLARALGKLLRLYDPEFVTKNSPYMHYFK